MAKTGQRVQRGSSLERWGFGECIGDNGISSTQESNRRIGSPELSVEADRSCSLLSAMNKHRHSSARKLERCRLAVGAPFFHANARDHIGATAFGVEARGLDRRLGALRTTGPT